jgi:hypothetical protein
MPSPLLSVMLSPRSQLSSDFERFGRALPADWAAHVRERYRIDLAARYLGQALPHPIGKGAGQLSLHAAQLEQDRDAGLAFVVLKTVIGERPDGSRRMAAWATPESRMLVERRAEPDGRAGWTVTWKGRGWAGTLAEYAALLRTGRAIARADGPLVVPSAKLHLPLAGEKFDREEYRHTLGVLAQAWGDGPLLLEKDFSPTLAGDARADDRETVLRWIRDVPDVVRSCACGEVRLAMKLMNARFGAGFQQAMLSAAAGADTVTVFNRLWDEERHVAFGGWALSDRNLAVLDGAGPGGPERSGTGNVCSGRQIVEYARRGCTSVQLHTFFQLPLSAYAATHGGRTARALHALVFDPVDGLVACLLELEEHGVLARHVGELRFLDLVAA